HLPREPLREAAVQWTVRRLGERPLRGREEYAVRVAQDLGARRGARPGRGAEADHATEGLVEQPRRRSAAHRARRPAAARRRDGGGVMSSAAVGDVMPAGTGWKSGSHLERVLA